jgi:quinoprotein glucose dehydrogenase
MSKRIWLALLCVVALAVTAIAQNDWKTYGNDAGHARFSTLTQITPENVTRLSKAWEFDTKTPGRKWQNTPVVINNTMYITLQNGGVVALEPETGKEIWRFETPVRGRSVRAVAYWPGDADASARLLYGAGDKLWALDPSNGKPIESFGNKGVADVHPGTPAAATTAARGAASDSDEGGRGGGRGGRGSPGFSFSISSPPAIYKNLAILGGSEGENSIIGPSGDPQAFDVKTGKLVWRFRAVPQPGDRNFGTWGDGWKDRGGPAIWGLITVDAERGMVFLPTGNPGGSFYGGDRPGDNLYAVSVLALDANTGVYKWHYQTTRHDVFDADLAGAPALIEVVRNGTRIPAVAQITKMGGMLFILDRVTGKPIFGVEDRNVPRSAVPGEVSAPTQPFPIKPAPWARLGMTKADLTTVTPESNRFCTEWWEKEQMYNDGAYTPYGAKGVAVVFSGTVGGGNWGGVAFNPSMGYIFVNTSNLATIGKMVAGPGGQYRNELSYTRFWDDNKYPCQQPPWGELVAVNANTGDVAWKVPLGVYPELIAKGIPPTGTPNLGGPIATAAGLVFIGATKDARFRAFDAKTGKELWWAQLEAAGAATPMTFMGRNGKQYVVIAAGGPGDTDRGGTETYPQKLVAFALSDGTPPAGSTPSAGRGAAAAAEATPALSAAAIDEGRRLADAACTACHALSADITTGRSTAAWKAVVDQMIGMGAVATPEEARKIADYLSHTYPPRR